MCDWICPNWLSLLPNASRSRACAFIASIERRAIPRLIAASAIRSISRLRIMQSAAALSSPTWFAAGTRQSSKTSSAVIDARMPHLSSIFWPSENPSQPFSTMNMLTSLRLSPVLAYTRYVSPVVSPSSVPFVIHILAPLIDQYSPHAERVAVVRMPSTSVPASGSDMHMPPMVPPTPAHAGGRYLATWWEGWCW
jgi:hypothetical protein